VLVVGIIEGSVWYGLDSTRFELVLDIIESSIWYGAYRAFNAGGVRGLLPVILGVTVSSVRKTVARLLVLTVSLGYGVVRPTLGSTAYRVGLFGAVYFVFSAAFDVASNVSSMSDYSVPTRLFIVLPVGILDAFFYWWTFTALTRTLSQLSSRRQSAKLLLYRRFSRVLLVAVLISVAWVLGQMAFIMADSLDERWSVLWVFDAFWHLLYFCMLLSITWLWSPSINNLQYAYYEQAEAEDEAEDG